MSLTPADKKPTLCVGEVSWDIRWVVDHLPGTVTDCFAAEVSEGPGGCALNSAMGLGTLGSAVELYGNRIDDARYGPHILQRLREKGVAARLTPTAGLENPVCQVFVEQGTGRRCFALNHKDAHLFDAIELKRVGNELSRGIYSVAFIQCYPRTLAETILSLAQIPTSTYALTQDLPNEDPLIAHFDLVQISLDETHAFSDAALIELAKRYRKGRCLHLLATHGAKGAYLISTDGSDILFEPVVAQVPAIDTTGCGDAFRAGFMHALQKGLSFKEALKLGASTGSRKALLKGSFI